MDPENNKAVVRRFNQDVIAGDDEAAFQALMQADFINRSVSPGADGGPASMWNTFHYVLHPALSEMSVIIHDQVAEGDKVVTRKTIRGVHTGALMGIEPTGMDVAIDVIDFVRLKDGRYAEHWGINTLQSALAQLGRG